MSAAGALLEWGAASLRQLPWRATRDPWAVWVSEVMLQQTGVDRVVPFWRRVIDRWPEPPAMAAAPLSEVLREWQGLGYPRRARALHTAATLVRDRHGGRVPDDLDALLALPGVGPYTARAVLAFAFEADVGVLDTNVGRVLARMGGARLTPAAAQVAADSAVPPGHGWMWNQSMLDLGALVCTKAAPRCDDCPVRAWCAWQGSGADPAVGSAGVSRRQARFEGSLRQARGRFLARLAEGPVATDTLNRDAGDRDEGDQAGDMEVAAAESLLADGLVARRDGMWTLAD